MRLKHLTAQRFDARLRTAFRHASANRTRTDNLIVVAEAADGSLGFGEGCPRSYVTGESQSTALAFFNRHRNAWIAQITDLETLNQWRDTHAAEVDQNPAAYAAVELALLDAIGRSEGCSVEAMLGLEPLADSFQYSAVLGGSAWPIYRIQLWRYRRAGFTDFKLKLSDSFGKERRRLAPFRATSGPVRVRGDANNLWPDAVSCIAAMAPLQFPWFAIEEPVTAHRLDECRRIAKALHTRIILDESLVGANLPEEIHRDADRWILNCRVSKLGGVIRALSVIKEARSAGFQLVVGAHVGETSILTRAGLTLAMGAGDALVAQEGGFGTHLLRQDLVERPLMFGEAGILRPNTDLYGAGLGLSVDTDLLTSFQ